MSGFVALVNLDGGPVDPDLMHRLTSSMDFRGPDERRVWFAENVGLGNTLLATTAESRRDNQPCTLDARVWITGDVRVDARDDLKRDLSSRGCANHESATDAELILHAYQVWGEDCVHHLLGDFAFAIWDAPRRRLFCARDHFGVKPLFYSMAGNCLVVSNTLNCVRSHPSVSDELNDLAIADFLLFEINQDPATSAFADVQRLPAAHRMTWSEGAPRIARYWTLPTDGAIRYRRPSDYVDQFKELLQTAVDDRLRTDSVAVWMSGGLDSPAVAATAQGLLAGRPGSAAVRAYTVVYDRVIPDQERHFSTVVARALGIPIHHTAGDDYELFERWDRPELQTPEPDDSPLAAVDVDQLRQIAEHSRVVLSGYGADPALYSSPSYLANLLKKGRLGNLVADVTRHLVTRRTLAGLGLRTLLRGRRGMLSTQSPYPGWLDQDLARRLDLPERWRRFHEAPAAVHPLRPEAYADLVDPSWSFLLECYDPGVTRVPVEPRHPFFDVRLVSFLLALPAIPWCIEKELLRQAMRGVLPDEVRLRPKAPLAGHPEFEMSTAGNRNHLASWARAPALTRYIDGDAMQARGTDPDGSRSDMYLRAICLNHWLQQLKPISLELKGEERFELTG